jgi:hypothetical protein
VSGRCTYTERATHALVAAEREARRFRHEYVGTEHVLLGLVQVGGVAANVLENLSIDLGKIRREVERIVQHGPDGAQVLTGRLPRTPRADRAIDYSAEEARSLHHDHVGIEHLLLGLLREQEGVAAQILMNLGADLEGVRAEVYRRRPAPWCWRTTDVVALARGIAADGAYDRLPILADALQEAGCDDDEVLGHLRQEAHGCRAGCWVLDRLLAADQRDPGDQPGADPAAPDGQPRDRKWWRFWG